MTRLRGWAPKGERLVDKVPQGRWKTATFLAALRNDRIDAPCLFDGPINGERFRAYVDQFLVPTLKPGDVVILDNLGSHKGKAVRRRSAMSARALCSCRNTPPTSTPSSRSSQSSRPCSEKSEREPTKPSAKPRRNPCPISARRMRRIPQERRLRVDPKQDALMRGSGADGFSDTSLSLSAIRPSSGSEWAFIFRIALLRWTFTVASAMPIPRQSVC